eukprot:13157509-Ditylum_brightwellii.AAC.1
MAKVHPEFGVENYLKGRRATGDVIITVLGLMVNHDDDDSNVDGTNDYGQDTMSFMDIEGDAQGLQSDDRMSLHNQQCLGLICLPHYLNTNWIIT